MQWISIRVLRLWRRHLYMSSESEKQRGIETFRISFRLIRQNQSVVRVCVDDESRVKPESLDGEVKGKSRYLTCEREVWCECWHSESRWLATLFGMYWDEWVWIWMWMFDCNGISMKISIRTRNGIESTCMMSCMSISPNDSNIYNPTIPDESSTNYWNWNMRGRVWTWLVFDECALLNELREPLMCN